LKDTCTALPSTLEAFPKGTVFQFVIPCATTLEIRACPGKWISILFRDCSESRRYLKEWRL